MAITRKDYVLKVTEQMAENAKAVLSGHGLKSQFINLISKRPDIIAKLAVLAWSSKTASKGGKALQKKNNFKITAYANFANFNFGARQDVEKFMEKLTPADQASFSNDENILTILAMGDTPVGIDLEADIVNGKSVALPFAKSVMKQYKFGTGAYIVVMFGDSWLQPKEEKTAKSKAKVNSRLQARRSPAKVRAELVSKANAKKADLKSDAIKLKNAAAKHEGALQQFNNLAATVGAPEGASAKEALAAIKAYNTTNKKLIAGLSSDNLRQYNKAARLYMGGEKAKANSILAKIGIPELTDLVRGGNNVSTDKIVAARKKALTAKIKEISAANEELLVKVAESTNSKYKADTNFKIRANVAKIKELRARIASFSELTTIGAVKNKASLLSKANALIAANLKAGQSVQAALQNALSKLPVDDDTKEQIRQQVIEGVAQQVPMQYAVQQAIQNVDLQADDEVEAAEEEMEDDLGLDDDLELSDDTSLAGSKSIQDILANL
jgi:hypothetical protein